MDNGESAWFAGDRWPALDQSKPEDSIKKREAYYKHRTEIRAQDISFVLDKLENLNKNSGSIFFNKLDLSSTGVLGHSVGGITAFEALYYDNRLKSAVNLDGLIAGLPFFIDSKDTGIQKSFLLINKKNEEPSEEKLLQWKVTKEQWKKNGELNKARIQNKIQSITSAGYYVLLADATHETFSDIPLLMPNFSRSLSDRNLSLAAVSRELVLTFFKATLKGEAISIFKDVPQHYSGTEMKILD